MWYWCRDLWRARNGSMRLCRRILPARNAYLVPSMRCALLSGSNSPGKECHQVARFVHYNLQSHGLTGLLGLIKVIGTAYEGSDNTSCAVLCIYVPRWKVLTVSTVSIFQSSRKIRIFKILNVQANKFEQRIPFQSPSQMPAMEIFITFVCPDRLIGCVHTKTPPWPPRSEREILKFGLYKHAFILQQKLLPPTD